MLAKPRRMGALILLLLLGLQMGAPSPAGAKTYAYLVDLERNVVKLDTDTDTIVGRAMLTNLPAFIGEDHQVVGAASDNLFFDVYGVGAFRVAVFDLRALTFRRDLGIASSTTPRFLVPPTQGQFFVEWFDPTASPGQGSQVVSRFDKASLARLGDIAPPPSLDNRNAFSRDGARLYSYQSDEQRVLRTFETGQLQLVSTLDIPPLFAPGL